MDFSLADIIAIRGSGWFADGILAAETRQDGKPAHVSHVGMVTSIAPAQVTEALIKVKTRPIKQTIAGAVSWWLLSPRNLSDKQRTLVVNRMLEMSGWSYGWSNILLQAADTLFKTDWFTDHLTSGLHSVYCSEAVAIAYDVVGYNFGHGDLSVTPQDIWQFAAINSDKYDMIPGAGAFEG